MDLSLFFALILPFLGTAAGAACVFFCRKPQESIPEGFAAGVMTAAAVWSLLIPALERSAHLNRYAFLPVAGGLLTGYCLFLLLNCRLSRSDKSMLTAAVTLHNFPEGMAVGAAIAGFLSGLPGMSLAGIFTLSLGITLQNLPEGAILSMPAAQRGESRKKAFAIGALSGIVEPIGGFLTILLAQIAVPALPFLLAFSAGAMLYVVVTELTPPATGSPAATLSFAAGFTLMMTMDVALG